MPMSMNSFVVVMRTQRLLVFVPHARPCFHAAAAASALAPVCAPHGPKHVVATDRDRDLATASAPVPAFAHGCAPVLVILLRC